MKGQMHVLNLFDLFYVAVFYVIVVYPILTVLINTLVLDLQAHPAAYTDVVVFLLQLIPISLGISVLLLIWFFGIPHQEQRY